MGVTREPLQGGGNVEASLFFDPQGHGREGTHFFSGLALPQGPMSFPGARGLLTACVQTKGG